jgi:hypothetical protein
MADGRINRKELWPRLKNIKKKDVWIRAARELGLNVTQPKGGSSHFAIRLPRHNNYNIKGLISIVYDPVRKDISEAIFKKLLNFGYPEDDIWRSLKLLK